MTKKQKRTASRKDCEYGKKQNKPEIKYCSPTGLAKVEGLPSPDES